MNPGLYIHIPFCEQHCYYCAFTVAVSPENTFEPYVRRLVRELELSSLGDVVETVYLGGGTPSLLSGDLLARVLAAAPTRVAKEVSIEVNPGTLSAGKLAQYRELGINRVSLGAQSLEDEDLQRAGRLHKSAAVYADFDLLRSAGFSNINLDLIAGLPNQRLETWIRNLDGILALRPEHISLYMLDHEERSAWAKLPSGIPDENDFADFYTEAENRLGSAGYRHYEISNWALPGRECQHNLGYWSGVPYRGVGVGAHSYDGNRRFWNTTSLAEYANLLDAGRLPICGEETLTPELRLEEAFMLGLRQTQGMDVRLTASSLGIVFPAEWHLRVEQLKDDGWIRFDGTILELTPKGRLAASSVIEEMIWPTP